MGEVYTSRLLKGGAALQDTRRVVELWDPGLSPGDNLRRLSAENLLAKPSRSRLDDLLYRVIQRRYVDPGPHLIPALTGLLTDARAFREACYYETARADDLLAAFAEGPLWEWQQQGAALGRYRRRPRLARRVEQVRSGGGVGRQRPHPHRTGTAVITPGLRDPDWRHQGAAQGHSVSIDDASRLRVRGLA